MTKQTQPISNYDCTQGIKNSIFIWNVDAQVADAILANIANHYGITTQEAFDEITHDEAEHLLDYITGPERAATSVLMQKYGM